MTSQDSIFFRKNLLGKISRVTVYLVFRYLQQCAIQTDTQTHINRILLVQMCCYLLYKAQNIMYEMRNLENGTNYRKSKTAGHMYEIQTTMFTKKIPKISMIFI